MTSAPSGRTTAGTVGRPRDVRIDVAVLEATLTVLDDAGYTGLTIEEVARRAGTSKPALYRRWPTRQHLVLAALARRLGDIDAPDTGCTLCDLGEGLQVFADAFDRISPAVLDPLLAECVRDDDLRETFMSSLIAPLRAAVGELVDRAAARGDLRADTDRELTVDLLGSLIHSRALFGRAPADDTDIETAVETLLRGIAADYPRLLEHARRAAGDPAIHHLHADEPA